VLSTQDCFVLNLKRLRKAKFNSQAEFAKLVGLTERGYQEYEQDKSKPTPEIIDRFAKQLGCKPLDLLRGPDAEPEIIRPSPADLKQLIEAPDAAPARATASVLDAILKVDVDTRAALLAVLYDDETISEPYLSDSEAKPKAR
jgi:transcriptional regulator with XRE-family HTH domain